MSRIAEKRTTDFLSFARALEAFLRFHPISGTPLMRKNVSVVAAYPANKGCRKDRTELSFVPLTLLLPLSSSLANVSVH